MMRALLLLSCVAAPVAAQGVTVDVPNILAFVNVDRPFPGGIGRYQQWYNINGFAGAITEPMRFEQIEFFAGTQPTSQAAQINCEVLMGHGRLSGVTGSFDSNWSSPPVTVKSTGNVALNAAGPGQVCMTIPFTTQFTWDRARPVLIEIRVYGNSLQNQPFLYNFRGTTQSQGTTSRVYAAGSTGAVTGSVLQGAGMVTRFQARPGVVLEYGSGCAGAGGFVPANEVLEIPWPGITWNHRISNATSGGFAFWTIGDQDLRTNPIDLTTLFGLPSSNCLLLNNALNIAGPFIPVGGGPGAGVFTLPVQLPGTTGYVGWSLYTQWAVFDPAAANGLLAVTPGVWSIVAPVGG